MALQRTHSRSLRLRPRRWSSAAIIALALGCALVRGPHLSWVSSQWRSSRSPSNSHRAQNRHTPCQATTGDVAIVDNPAAVDASFEQKKEALRQCLAREYTSFFRPFEQSFYTDGVVFQDPLTRLEGKERYKMNVEMLSGESLIGNVLFTDGFITLHGIEDDPDNEFRLLTRWTLGFKFKLLPWRPEALFSGVSEYTIDADAKVVSQRDYWDTINLGSGGQYAPEQGLDGLADLVAQLLLPKADVKPTSWQLLRRTYDYEAYRSNGKIFAVLPKASSGDARSIATALRRHGLTPGDAVQDSGYTGIEVLSPNPWESSSA